MPDIHTIEGELFIPYFVRNLNEPLATINDKDFWEFFDQITDGKRKIVKITVEVLGDID